MTTYLYERLITLQEVERFRFHINTYAYMSLQWYTRTTVDSQIR